MSWQRDDGNPKSEGHEGTVACYVRDVLTGEWRELGGKWVPHKYADSIKSFADRKVWEHHLFYLYDGQGVGQGAQRNPEHERDSQEMVDDVGVACTCDWRSPRIGFNPSLQYNVCDSWDLDDAGYEDVRQRLNELWNEHMNEACGKRWTDADYAKHQREQERERVDKEIRAELESEARKKAKFDPWGRFQKKERRIPRPVTQADIDKARRDDPWRWGR